MNDHKMAAVLAFYNRHSLGALHNRKRTTSCSNDVPTNQSLDVWARDMCGYVWVSAADYYNGYRGGIGAVEITGIEPEAQLWYIN